MNVGSLYLVKDWYWILFSSKESALAAGADVAAYYSKRYKETVTYFFPESHIVFLEEDGKVKKVLTSDGTIGWTWFDEPYNDCFEEVKS